MESGEETVPASRDERIRRRRADERRVTFVFRIALLGFCGGWFGGSLRPYSFREMGVDLDRMTHSRRPVSLAGRRGQHLPRRLSFGWVADAGIATWPHVARGASAFSHVTPLMKGSGY
jgi:hypothetical protein